MRRSRAGRHLWAEHLRSLRYVFVFASAVILLMPILFFLSIGEDGRMSLISAGVFFFGMVGLWVTFHFWEKNWVKVNGNRERGARGEIAVGKELERLHVEGFHVFHDYKPEASGNVDHFLVGEGGFFIVETKAWSGEITTDGHEILRNGRSYPRSPVDQATSEACRIRELIKASCGINVWVQPVVCFVGDGLRVYGKVRDVEVTGLGSVNRSIMQISGKNPDYRRLSKSQVKVVSKRLEKHIGERPAASPGNPPDEPSGFHELWKKPELFVALYLLYFFVLSLVFAGKAAAMLAGLSELYGAVGVLRDVLMIAITAA